MSTGTDLHAKARSSQRQKGRQKDDVRKKHARRRPYPNVSANSFAETRRVPSPLARFWRIPAPVSFGRH